MRKIKRVSKSDTVCIPFVNFRINKKALSNLVAYVLLISITISLSVIVYGWLKFYVEQDPVAECPDGVNIVINSYECFYGSNGNLTIDLKNKGLFNVDGFVVRVHNRTNAEFGIYVLDSFGETVKPGKNVTRMYNGTGTEDDYDYNKRMTLVDVQPFLYDDDGKKVSCDFYASQDLICNFVV